MSINPTQKDSVLVVDLDRILGDDGLFGCVFVGDCDSLLFDAKFTNENAVDLCFSVFDREERFYFGCWCFLKCLQRE